MTRFTVTLSNQSVTDIDGADSYQQEGPLTTFFRRGSNRGVIDSWSVRLASIRTTDIVSVHRTDIADVGRLDREHGSHDHRQIDAEAAGLLQSA